MVGDGCAEPIEGEICSPIEGTLMNIFPITMPLFLKVLTGLK